MKSPQFTLVISLLALLAALPANAVPRKKGKAKNRPTTTESSSSSSSSLLLRPPSSLVAPTPPPAEPSPPPSSTDSGPKLAPADPARPESADSPPEPDADRPRIALMPLVLVGVQPLWEGRIYRHQEFTDPNLRQYGAMGYPSIALTAELYPLANTSSKFMRGFGVTFHYARAFGFTSDSARLGAGVDAAAQPVDTYFTRYAAGLRYRIHANPESQTPLVLGISAAMSGWSFDFGTELPRDPDLEIPTANYRMARVGLDAGLEVKQVTFYAAVGYLHAFSVASPSARAIDVKTYPYLADAPGMGGEFRGAVGVRVARWLELRLSLEYAIMAFHLQPLEGRPDEPARVLDSYLSAGLGPYVSF